MSHATRITPLRAVGRGLVAGAAGTAAMTAAQLAYMKATNGESSSTPAEVGRRIMEGVLQRDVPDSAMPALNNGMHVAYGTSWGAVYGLAAGGRRASPVMAGLGFGLAVWSASLLQLPAMKLAPPVWESSPGELLPDVGFHLVYGTAVGLAFRILS